MKKLYYEKFPFYSFIIILRFDKYFCIIHYTIKEKRLMVLLEYHHRVVFINLIFNNLLIRGNFHRCAENIFKISYRGRLRKLFLDRGITKIRASSDIHDNLNHFFPNNRLLCRNIRLFFLFMNLVWISIFLDKSSNNWMLIGSPLHKLIKIIVIVLHAELFEKFIETFPHIKNFTILAFIF